MQTRPRSSVWVGMKSQDTKIKDFKCLPEPLCTTLLFSNIATCAGAWLTMFSFLLEIQYRAVAVVFYVHIYIELDTWHVVYT